MHFPVINVWTHKSTKRIKQYRSTGLQNFGIKIRLASH